MHKRLKMVSTILEDRKTLGVVLERYANLLRPIPKGIWTPAWTSRIRVVLWTLNPVCNPSFFAVRNHSWCLFTAAVLPSGPTTPSSTSEPSRYPVIIPPNRSSTTPRFSFIRWCLTTTAAIPLTPDGQAVKEGFDHLGTAGDPRTGLGKIPNPPDTTQPTNHATSPSATQPIRAVPPSDPKNEPSIAVDPS